ncbi:MAG: sugar phosphate nucleotidyltransferase [Candidatus Micrarchaeota archaeon]|nr:sugar phosphate nucleotidyltransferase [Candidatus Micrarchaeota archaeon]
MKAIILCGGMGLRLREETQRVPKPMVEVCGKPILWHIMNAYSHFGFKDFILCIGYKGEVIRDYFSGGKHCRPDWNVTIADTGLESQTGSRIKQVERYISEDNFFVTYGDGLTDADIGRLLAFHKRQKTIGTLTAVHPHSKWGLIQAGKDGIVKKFVEKPVLVDYINGGYFVFKKEFFDFLSADKSCVLEKEPLYSLVKKRQLSMFTHEGFWHAMDTYKDYTDLNAMCANPPWVRKKK